MRKFILFLICCLLGLIHSVFAESLPDLTSQQKKLIIPIDRFYQWANTTYGTSHGKALSPSELQTAINHIFNPQVEHSLNGKVVVTSREDLYKRFSILSDKYKAVDVILPFKDIVVDVKQNKVSIAYSVKFTLATGQTKIFQALTIFKIKDNKISRFDEISSVEEDHL